MIINHADDADDADGAEHLPQLNRRYEPGDYQDGNGDDGHGWDDHADDDGDKTMILTRPDSCQRR